MLRAFPRAFPALFSPGKIAPSAASHEGRGQRTAQVHIDQVCRRYICQ